MGMKTLDHYGVSASVLDVNKIDKFYDQSKIVNDSENEDQSMMIKIDATRSGSVVNRRTYTGKSVDAKTKRFTSPYQKPFLKNHDHDNVDNAIGRIEDATFERLESNDTKFFNDFAYAKENAKGSGRIMLDVRVTDAKARVKILDKSYLTVSTGQSLSNIRCSHCDGDPLSWTGSCDHYPGKVEELDESSPLVALGVAKKGDKRLVYLITDVEDYLEVSQVNIPAQPMAMIKEITDSLVAQGIPDDRLKGYCDLFVSSDFARIGNCLTDALLVDSNGMRQGLLSDDFSQHVNKTVTGKTTVTKSRPADEDTETLSDAEKKQTLGTDDVDTGSTEIDNNKDNNLSTEDQGMKPEGDNSQDVSTDTINILTESNVALKADKIALEEKLTASDEAKAQLGTDLSDMSKTLTDSQAETLLTIRKVTDHSDVSALDDEAEKAYLEKLQARSFDSLKDSIDDEKPAFLEKVERLSKDKSDTFGSDDVDDPTKSDTSKDDKSNEVDEIDDDDDDIL